MDHITIHDCGGAILTATAWDGYSYDYCDKCSAFAFAPRKMPSGTDRTRNNDAFQNGEDCSPSAPESHA